MKLLHYLYHTFPLADDYILIGGQDVLDLVEKKSVRPADPKRKRRKENQNG